MNLDFFYNFVDLDAEEFRLEAYSINLLVFCKEKRILLALVC